jgi:hypothetical protein
MPKKETKILIIILLLINLLSISAFVFIYNYTKGLIVRSVETENIIKTEIKKEDSRVLMKGDVILGEMYQDKLMEYIIPSGGTVEFLKTLEQLVLNTGLKYDIQSVENLPYAKGGAIGAELLKINVNVIGEWNSIQYFLKSLENYPLKIDISDISLNKVSDYVVGGKTIPQWSGSFEFTVVKLIDNK